MHVLQHGKMFHAPCCQHKVFEFGGSGEQGINHAYAVTIAVLPSIEAAFDSRINVTGTWWRNTSRTTGVMSRLNTLASNQPPFLVCLLPLYKSGVVEPKRPFITNN